MEWTKKLSEAILLQSLEDLFSGRHRLEALKFFAGEEFKVCASIIGLSAEDNKRLFEIVKSSRIAGKSVPVTQISGKIKSLPKVSQRTFQKGMRPAAVCHP